MFFSLGMHVHVGCCSPGDPKYLVFSSPVTLYSMSRSLRGPKHDILRAGLGELHIWDHQNPGHLHAVWGTRAEQHTPAITAARESCTSLCHNCCWMR